MRYTIIYTTDNIQYLNTVFCALKTSSNNNNNNNENNKLNNYNLKRIYSYCFGDAVAEKGIYKHLGYASVTFFFFAFAFSNANH